ncbi:sulfatase family protein [Rubinisphaera italica]|uniref:Arylsulfatase n=1 Tax=Rubinisphaera italica TaxID=2527969 RepID=A0A5C5XD45_9PLAN|nr:sulfatase [Rubinisphaera italica]TWT60311.1 Arylsulfatase [Rubinisphaera italica]
MVVKIFAVLALLISTCMTADAARKPNVIIIYCDDLGYGDIGCFGSDKHRTPNIDQLSSEGLTLTNFYVTSGVCTPSRSSLMTGCYPKRIGMHQNEKGGWVLFPGNHQGLNPQETTIAEVLKQAGYATKIVGKWHLGDQPEFLPTRQGFDSYFGIPFSNDMGYWIPKRNYPPLPLMRDESVIEQEPDQSQLTKRYTEEAISFLENHQSDAFFLYWPHTFPHVPLYASQAFKGKSKNGDYGDAVEEIDWSVGELSEALKRLELEKNTLVIFTSDNGAAQRWGGSNGPLRGYKGSTWEGGMRVPCIMKWPATIPAGTVSREIVSTLDILPTLASIVGQKLPENRIIDGLDLSQMLANPLEISSPRDTMYYYYKSDLCAVRHENWKLHVRPSKANAGQNYQPELYNLSNDIGETRSVYDENPEVVYKLTELIEFCRNDLGDGKHLGKNTREPGFVKNPKTLTEKPITE